MERQKNQGLKIRITPTLYFIRKNREFFISASKSLDRCTAPPIGECPKIEASLSCFVLNS